MLCYGSGAGEGRGQGACGGLNMAEEGDGGVFFRPGQTYLGKGSVCCCRRVVGAEAGTGVGAGTRVETGPEDQGGIAGVGQKLDGGMLAVWDRR